MNIYSTYEMKLANEIAATLHDWNALPTHLLFTRKYTEQYLRKQLGKVMAKDESSFRTSRGAYFTFLVNKYKNEDGARR